MYEETVFNRENLHSAMDALERLDKPYRVKRILGDEYNRDRWIIKETPEIEIQYHDQETNPMLIP